MGNLTQLIKLYETKGVDAVLKEERLWTNLETLKQELDTYQPKEKEDLEKRFTALLEDLAKNQADLMGEMEDAKQRVSSAIKNEEACLSYTEASGRHKPGRQKG